jgi:FMN phosphatase YigB (HAD superfamily)
MLPTAVIIDNSETKDIEPAVQLGMRAIRVAIEVWMRLRSPSVSAFRSPIGPYLMRPLNRLVLRRPPR